VSDERVSLQYLLARTIVCIGGTVTVETKPSGDRFAVRASEVTLGVEGDYDVPPLTLKLDPKWWENREFGLDTAADGRLTGANHASEGLGGQLIGAAVSVVTTLGKLASLGFGIDKLPPALLDSVPIDEEFAAEKPEPAKRRADLAKAIHELQGRLIAAVSGATAKAEIETLQLALVAARAEAAVIETQFEAWRAERYPIWKTMRSYRLGTDQLPVRDTAETQLELEPGELKGSVAEAAAALGVVVVRIGNEDPTQHTAPDPGDDALLYRIPNRLALAVYEVEDAEVPADEKPNPPTKLQLRSVVPAWVVDSLSAHLNVPLRSAFFSKHGTTIAFGDAGTLTKLTNKATSGVASAVSGMGGQVVGGLDAAAKIAAAFPAAPDPELKALKDKVERKELEAKLVVANKTIAGNSPTRSEASTSGT
jgi:hypothetical protein